MAEAIGDKDGLYAVLGVPPSASPDDVKRAYRQLALQHHPDKRSPPADSVGKSVGNSKEDAAGDEDAETFKRISHAYSVLGDADKRAEYDSLSQPAADVSFEFGQGGSFMFGGLHDILMQTLMHGMPFGAGGPADGIRIFASHGGMMPDMHMHMNMNMNANMNNMFGARQPQSQPEQNRTCDVTVSLTLSEVLLGAQRRISYTDPNTGRGHTLELRIPPGTARGQTLVPGRSGSSPKPLVITFDYDVPAGFRVDYQRGDVFCSVPIDARDVFCGVRATVDLTYETLEIREAPGAYVCPERVYRVPGKGLPVGGQPRGDACIEWRVNWPQELPAGFHKYADVLRRIFKRSVN